MQNELRHLGSNTVSTRVGVIRAVGRLATGMGADAIGFPQIGKLPNHLFDGGISIKGCREFPHRPREPQP